MSSQYISSTFVKRVVTTGGRALKVDVIDRTNAWIRPANYPSESIKEEFVKLVQEQGDNFKTGVDTVAMKESAHQSPGDPQTHYSCYGLSEDKKEVLDAKHLKK